MSNHGCYSIFMVQVQLVNYCGEPLPIATSDIGGSSRHHPCLHTINLFPFCGYYSLSMVQVQLFNYCGEPLPIVASDIGGSSRHHPCLHTTTLFPLCPPHPLAFLWLCYHHCRFRWLSEGLLWKGIRIGRVSRTIGVKVGSRGLLYGCFPRHQSMKMCRSSSKSS